MGFFSKLDKHADLMGGMADRVGLDMAEKMVDESVANGYRAAIIRCATCREAGACAQWQAEHATAEHTPGYCRNAGWFEALATK
ncbi:DUF6455 family protein [Pseudooceanicola marinus]|uniref:DUF6455 family protein n=1 Tax=Pseudooceanicola marinus TaxID=396013 RepID=UPI001C969FB5|nr:DUF6455 family protein [Pseudooceanicola marinus]MBY5974436.1 hypothetical protein [Ferrimonas balearica]MCA1336480.1 DUF6455 family protein [Pseudooceanicola marinus]